jgi:hypothetical protein
MFSQSVTNGCLNRNAGTLFPIPDFPGISLRVYGISGSEILSSPPPLPSISLRPKTAPHPIAINGWGSMAL